MLPAWIYRKQFQKRDQLNCSPNQRCAFHFSAFYFNSILYLWNRTFNSAGFSRRTFFGNLFEGLPLLATVDLTDSLKLCCPFSSALRRDEFWALSRSMSLMSLMMIAVYYLDGSEQKVSKTSLFILLNTLWLPPSFLNFIFKICLLLIAKCHQWTNEWCFMAEQIRTLDSTQALGCMSGVSNQQSVGLSPSRDTCVPIKNDGAWLCMVWRIRV